MSIPEWQLRRKHQIKQGQRSVATEEEELLSIRESLENTYGKSTEAEHHYPPCKLISPSIPSVSPERIKDLYADIVALREKTSSQTAETKTEDKTPVPVQESASLASPLKPSGEMENPARLLSRRSPSY